MKEYPILFTGDMVCAIQQNRKRMTRRVVKGALKHFCDFNGLGNAVFTDDEIKYKEIKCPYGQPGDRLWVRETFGFVAYMNDGNDNWIPWVPDRPAMPIHELKFGAGYQSGFVIYAADGFFEWNAGDDSTVETCSLWHPSIHMKREIARILLEVVSVRVERLHHLTEEDAKAEGVECCYDAIGLAMSYRRPFWKLWDSINAKRGFGWDVNPWVWVIEFKVLPAEGAKA